MSTYIIKNTSLAEAGMIDGGIDVDMAGIEYEELSQPTPSQEVKMISRLTSSYIVEARKLLTSTKYILRLLKRD